MKKRVVLAAVAIAGTMVLTACSSSGSASPTSAATGGASTAAPSSAAPSSAAPSSAAPSSGGASSAAASSGGASSAAPSSADASGGMAAGDCPAAPKTDGVSTDLKTTISILAPSYTDKSQGDWQCMIKGFNKTYPNVTVKLQIEAWANFTAKVQARIQGNDAPDILNDNNFGEAADNLLYPMDEVVSKDTLATIVPSLLKNGQGTDGKQWALPDIASARILVYNKDLFDKAGITSPPKTWDEELAAAKKISALGNGISGYGMPLGHEEAQVEASLWIWGNGGSWVTDGKIKANTPTNIAGFEAMKNFITQNATEPNPGSTARQEVADAFDQGKIGMYVAHTGLLDQTRTKHPEIKFGLTTVPSKDGSPVALGVTDFIVAFNNKDDGRKQATKAFLDYFYSPEVYYTWAVDTGLMPVTTDAIAKAAAAAPYYKPFYDALPAVRFLPVGNPQWATLQDALQTNAGLIQSQDAKPTLDAIQAQVEASG